MTKVMRLPLRLKLYVLTVAVAGALCFAEWQRIWPLNHGWTWPGAELSAGAVDVTRTVAVGAWLGGVLLPASFAGLIAASLLFPLRLTPGFMLTVDLGAKFAALLLFGPPVALVAAGVSTAVANLLQAVRGKRDVWNVTFNTGLCLLGMGVAGVAVYPVYGGVPRMAPIGFEGPAQLVAALVGGLLLYATNVLAVAVAVGLQHSKHPLAVWQRGGRIELEYSLILLLIGLLVALLVRHYAWTLAALVLLTWLVYRSQKRTLHLLLAERAAREEAEQAIRARGAFLAVASHELRTPVTSLRGYTQFLLRQCASGVMPSLERLQRALRVIDQQSDRLARLVSQLLDISRLQSGKLILECRPINLTALLEEVVANVQPTTHHPLVLRPPPNTRTAEPVWAVGDPLRLEQVVVNLVDNAIKYSLSGEPIELEAVQVSADVAQIAIRDWGIAVSPEEGKDLFNRFLQADGSRETGGMGLGLHISQQIVEAHHGRIEVEAPKDGGTRFLVILPASSPDPDSCSTPSSVSTGLATGKRLVH